MSVTDEKIMLTSFDETQAERALAMARETLDIEGDAIRKLNARLDADDSLARAVALMLACKGRVVVSGIGKSGHIARKIAATLASTGTPATSAW
jgi:arabinose-5-phosphate isomerase